jgi:5-methylcytosine-specific restriction endonuclease McrA
MVTLRVPAPIRVAFEETLDLHRAVVGGHAGVADFVEALVAEAPVNQRNVEPVPEKITAVPEAPARVIGSLDDSDFTVPAFASPAIRAALDCLERVENCIATPPARAQEDPMDRIVHLERTIHELLRLEDEIETHVGTLLAEMHEQGAWRQLQCANAAEYGEERLGMSRTTVWRRATIVRRLRGLHDVRAAYLQGHIGLEAADTIRRALGGTADTATQRAWIDRARRATLKRLQDDQNLAARERLLGKRATPPPDDAAWNASLHRRPGRGIAVVLDMSRRALAAIENGCTSPDVFLRMALPPDLASGLRLVLEERRRALAEDSPTPVNPRPSQQIARALRRRRCGVPQWVAMLALLEEYVVTWDASPRRKGDSVYERAGWRCAAPGCTARRNLEVHHVVYRARGGANVADNLVCLCRSHHQFGEHAGRLRCRGQAPLGVVWRLGIPRLATWLRNEMRLDAANARC